MLKKSTADILIALVEISIILTDVEMLETTNRTGGSTRLNVEIDVGRGEVEASYLLIIRRRSHIGTFVTQIVHGGIVPVTVTSQRGVFGDDV